MGGWVATFVGWLAGGTQPAPPNAEVALLALAPAAAAAVAVELAVAELRPWLRVGGYHDDRGSIEGEGQG